MQVRALGLVALALSACAPDHYGTWVSTSSSACGGCEEVEFLYFQSKEVSHAYGGLRCRGARDELYLSGVSYHVYQLEGTQLRVGAGLTNAGTLVLNDDGTLRTDGIASDFDGLYRRPEGEEAAAVEKLFQLGCHAYWGQCYGASFFDAYGPPCAKDADCPDEGRCDLGEGWCYASRCW